MAAKRKLPVALSIDESFKANLDQLPPIDDIACIKLTPVGSDDAEPDVIENKPGKAGSVRVYNYLLEMYGGKVTRQAAYLACAIYAEATEDAHRNPGKHGNIDRLFKIIETGVALQGVVVQAEAKEAEGKSDA